MRKPRTHYAQIPVKIVKRVITGKTPPDVVRERAAAKTQPYSMHPASLTARSGGRRIRHR
jgi:hypothetical protein